MLSIDFDETAGIAILEPDGPLTKNDFESAARTIDPYIERGSALNGLIVHTESFPGWESFAALVSHLKFVKEHHRKVSRIAFSTDSAIGSYAETIASHFVNADIRSFSYRELEQAKKWVGNNAEK